MYIKEGDRVRVSYNPAINEKYAPSWINKKGIVDWTDGYMYDVILEETEEKITVYWNDLKKIR